MKYIQTFEEFLNESVLNEAWNAEASGKASYMIGAAAYNDKVEDTGQVTKAQKKEISVKISDAEEAIDGIYVKISKFNKKEDSSKIKYFQSKIKILELCIEVWNEYISLKPGVDKDPANYKKLINEIIISDKLKVKSGIKKD